MSDLLKPYQDEIEALSDELGLGSRAREAAEEIWALVSPLYKYESYSPAGVAGAVLWRAALEEEGYTRLEVARNAGVDTRTISTRWSGMKEELPAKYAP